MLPTVLPHPQLGQLDRLHLLFPPCSSTVAPPCACRSPGASGHDTAAIEGTACPVPRLCSARSEVDPGAYALWRWGVRARVTRYQKDAFAAATPKTLSLARLIECPVQAPQLSRDARPLPFRPTRPYRGLRVRSKGRCCEFVSYYPGVKRSPATLAQ